MRTESPSCAVSAGVTRSEPMTGRVVSATATRASPLPRPPPADAVARTRSVPVPAARGAVKVRVAVNVPANCTGSDSDEASTPVVEIFTQSTVALPSGVTSMVARTLKPGRMDCWSVVTVTVTGFGAVPSPQWISARTEAAATILRHGKGITRISMGQKRDASGLKSRGGASKSARCLLAPPAPSRAPAPSATHQRAVAGLLVRLANYLQHQPWAEVLASPADISFHADMLVQPDLFVLPITPDEGRVQGWSQIRTLLLAIEVLSPSTARADRQVKRRFYQQERVGEYWIVDVDARIVERWRATDERPEIVSTSLRWHPEPSAAPFELDLPAFFDDVLRNR